MFDGFFGAFYRFGETVLLLLYVNVLWILFTLLGLVIFGIGPSTIAMYTVFRRWSMGESDVPVFVTFWKSFKGNFFKANLLALILIVVGYMLYVNRNYFQLDDAWFSIIVRYIILIVSFIYAIMLIYIFPLFVHYDNKFTNYFKNSILIAVYHPIRTIYAIAALFTLYYLFTIFPVFIFLMGPSLISLVVMWITYRTFLRIEYKQAQFQEDVED